MSRADDFPVWARIAKRLRRYSYINWGNDYHEGDHREQFRTDDLDDAVCVSSELADKPGTHIVAIDLDVPAVLVPSSTPGHSHLYIDVEMDWEEYDDLLKTLWGCGIVELGYYNASHRRRATRLRTPWTKKEVRTDGPPLPS